MLDNNVFFDIVIKALKAREPFSTVRMSDGERKIIEWARTPGLNPATPIDNALFDGGWHKRFGTAGIRADTILARLTEGFTNCTYFCPGDRTHHLFPKHKNEYVDNSYHYEWTRAQRNELLETAGDVIVINRDLSFGDAIHKNLKCGVWSLQLDKWQETSGIFETILKRDREDHFPLVLLSGGPAAKHLAPHIAAMTECMVLDIGQGADAWWMKTGIEAV